MGSSSCAKKIYYVSGPSSPADRGALLPALLCRVHINPMRRDPHRYCRTGIPSSRSFHCVWFLCVCACVCVCVRVGADLCLCVCVSVCLCLCLCLYCCLCLNPRILSLYRSDTNERNNSGATDTVISARHMAACPPAVRFYVCASVCVSVCLCLCVSCVMDRETSTHAHV